MIEAHGLVYRVYCLRSVLRDLRVSGLVCGIQDLDSQV